MRVIVTGGRNYADERAVRSVLDYLRDRTGHLTVIQGGAGGADQLARQWGWEQDGVSVVTVPANWHKHGKSAGPIRNRTMLDQCSPDLVVAFPGGKGTASMMRLAKSAGVPVVMIHDQASPSRTSGRLRTAMEIARGKASGRLVGA